MTTDVEFPFTMSELESLRFDRWYPLFRKLTIRSEIITLSKEFVKYLLSDGVVLPRCDERTLSTQDPRFVAKIVMTRKYGVMMMMTMMMIHGPYLLSWKLK